MVDEVAARAPDVIEVDTGGTTSEAVSQLTVSQIATGVRNGDFHEPPPNDAAPLNNTDNRLPGWVVVNVDGTVDVYWRSDASGSGGRIDFDGIAGVAMGHKAYIEQTISAVSTGGRNSAHLPWVQAADQAGTFELEAQFLDVSDAATGAAGTITTPFAPAAANGTGVGPDVATKLRLRVSGVAVDGTVGTLAKVYEVYDHRASVAVYVVDGSDPTKAPSSLTQVSGSTNLVNPSASSGIGLLANGRVNLSAALTQPVLLSTFLDIPEQSAPATPPSGYGRHYTSASGVPHFIDDAGVDTALTGGGGLADGDKGDITVSSSGAVWDIDAGVVGTTELADGGTTLAKLANLATNKLVGRATAGTGVPEAIDLTAAGRALIDDADAAAQRTTLGLGTVATLASDTDGTLAANSDTRVATQKATKTYVDTAVTGLLEFKGATDCSANPNYPAALKGDTYVVSVAGKIGGASGKSVEIGDMYLATADNAGGTEASVGTSWSVLEHNLVGAVLAANNLSDLANAGTARTNLGLGALAVLAQSGLDFAESGDLAAIGSTASAGSNTEIPFADHVHAHEAAHINHDTTWAAKGDLIAGTGNDAAAVLSVGADDTIPMADAAQATGIKWVASGTPSTQAMGDSAAVGTADTFTRGDHKHALPSKTDFPLNSVLFPATQVASADANSLDDYEEGTFTPTFDFVTHGNLNIVYSVQVGRYLKVGNRVFWYASITTSTFTHTTASGNATIGGLPFTAANVTSVNPVGAGSCAGWTKANYTAVNPVVVLNTATALLSAMGSGQALLNLANTEFPTGGTLQLRLSGFYEV